MKTVSNQFYQTRNMFKEACGWEHPLTYDDWMKVSDDMKAAILYIQFFDQVTLAWSRLRTPAAVEEECVSEVLMYLQKNVDKIRSDEKRFTPAYLYRVCYNCIYCRSVDPYSGQTAATSWYNNTTSNIMNGPEDTFDLFDLTESKSSASYPESEEEHNTEVNTFWQRVQEIGEDAVEVADDLISGESTSNVTEARKAEIIQKLRELFVEFDGLF